MQLHNTFSALGDATRFAIVQRLLDEGEKSAGDLQDTATISPPAISRHLKVLRQAGVIRQRVDQQRRMYSVYPDVIRSIHSWVMDHQSFWNNSLARLERALMQEKGKK